MTVRAGTVHGRGSFEQISGRDVDDRWGSGGDGDLLRIHSVGSLPYLASWSR